MVLKYYIFIAEEYSGWDCDGHRVPHIVAAENIEQANMIASGYEILENPVLLKLPSLNKKRKPFEFDLDTYCIEESETSLT